MVLRVVRTLLLGIAAAAIVAGVWLRVEYPGALRFVAKQMRYAAPHENRNIWFMVGYWLEFIQKMRLDPNTGAYNFNRTPVEGQSEYERGRIEFHKGAFARAIALIQSDIRQKGESEDKLFWLGLAYMRRGETENCLPALQGAAMPAAISPMPDHAFPAMQMCSLPLTSPHQKAEYARRAADTFQALLDRYNADDRLYRWLLNLNYMTLGQFPAGVPEKYRINTPFIDTFYGKGRDRAAADFPDFRFEDQAKQLGVNTFHPGRGVAVEDFDGDGYLDIVTGGSYGPVRFYKNDHGHGFIDKTVGSGLEKVSQILVIVAADYDNDGLPDLLIARPFDHYVLYRNNGNGTFSDVTRESGLLDLWKEGNLAATWIPSFADVNNDGKLDIFLAQWSLGLPFANGGPLARPRMDSALFIQENGRFVNRTKDWGLEALVKDNFFIGSAFGDYDNDGYPDLFLSSPIRDSSVLLHNAGGKRFERTKLIDGISPGFAAAFLDINHDGRLDILQAGSGDGRSAVEQVVFGEHTNEYRSGHSVIFLQKPDGTFERHEEIFDMPVGTMGVSFGDINNDGCYDFYFGKGSPEPWFILPNMMYVGGTNGHGCTLEMRNVSMLNGLGNIQKGHGIVFFDFNDDGRQDIYSALGGMWPGDAWTSQLFTNQSKSSNTWTKIRLRGRKTNYAGIGAAIRVRAENARHEEIVRYYHMDNKSGFGSAPFLAHIGLMDAVKIQGVDVFWPVSGCKTTYPATLTTLNVLDENQCSASDKARGSTF